MAGDGTRVSTRSTRASLRSSGAAHAGCVGEESSAAATTSRRAFGDVSNRQRKNSSKASSNSKNIQPVRRSRRISSTSMQVDPIHRDDDGHGGDNQESSTLIVLEEDVEMEPVPSRRRSSRLSTQSDRASRMSIDTLPAPAQETNPDVNKEQDIMPIPPPPTVSVAAPRQRPTKRAPKRKRSQKAATASSNAASLDDPVDMLLEPPPAQRRRRTSWSCEACTFDNTNPQHISKCEMCGSKRSTTNSSSVNVTNSTAGGSMEDPVDMLLEPPPTKPRRPRSTTTSSSSSSRNILKNNHSRQTSRPAAKSSAIVDRRNLCPDILRTSDFSLIRDDSSLATSAKRSLAAVAASANNSFRQGSSIFTSFDASKYTSGVSPYDRRHQHDVLQCPKYVTDIFQRLYDSEERTKPMQRYMKDQPHLNSMMRAILIDWLVEVHAKFRLVPETLYLGVNIIDRYLSEEKVDKKELQLVGITSLLLACKYEEIYPPEVKDCVYITDKAYTREQVLEMEAKIVKTLKFHLTVPTAYNFLIRFLHVTEASETVKNLARYYSERMLQEYDSLRFRPSVLAAAAVTLAVYNPTAMELENRQGNHEGLGMPAALQDYTKFDARKVGKAAEFIVKTVPTRTVTGSRRELSSVSRKYEQDRFDRVSRFTSPLLSHVGVLAAALRNTT